jgi:hypothetical protein
VVDDLDASMPGSAAKNCHPAAAHSNMTARRARFFFVSDPDGYRSK